MRRISILLILTFFTTFLFAQKAYKELRNHLKDKKGKEAAALVVKLSADSILSNDPKLYDFGKQAQILLNDVENEKIYLKKSYDTLSFFRSTCQIFDYIMKCDKLEQQNLAEKGKKMKFRKENRELLHRYYRNLSAAGRYFYSKKNYEEAASTMKLYLTLPYTSIWGDDKSVTKKDVYHENVYIYQNASFLSKNYTEVSAYKEITLSDTTYRCSYLELLTLSAEALHDTVSYVAYLKEGLPYYAENPFFFTRLTDYYTQQGDYETALVLADSLLKNDCLNLLLLEAKNLALLNLERFEEAIQASLYTLRLNDDAIETYFYIGAAYCNLANDIVLPTNFNSKEYKALVEKQKTYYRMAQPYVEHYRKMAPNQQQRWAPLLYRIYLVLNIGEKFDEIDELMKGMKMS